MEEGLGGGSAVEGVGSRRFEGWSWSWDGGLGCEVRLVGGGGRMLKQGGGRRRVAEEEEEDEGGARMVKVVFWLCLVSLRPEDCWRAEGRGRRRRKEEGGGRSKDSEGSVLALCLVSLRYEGC